MRSGFPSHMNTSDLFNVLKMNSEFSEHVSKDLSKDQKEFWSAIVRSCGLKWNDFKLRNSKIFFRRGKHEILKEKIENDLQTIINRYRLLKMLRRKWRILIVFARQYFRFAHFLKLRQFELGIEPCLNTAAQPRAQTKSPQPIPSQADWQAESQVPAKVASEPFENQDKPRDKRDALKGTTKRKPGGLANQKSKQQKVYTAASTAEYFVERSTIAIPSKEVRFPETTTTENQLRSLLHQERKKNDLLNSDYSKLRRRNLELTERLATTTKANELLTNENENLKKIVKTYQNNILCEHNYQSN